MLRRTPFSFFTKNTAPLFLQRSAAASASLLSFTHVGESRFLINSSKSQQNQLPITTGFLASSRRFFALSSSKTLYSAAGATTADDASSSSTQQQQQQPPMENLDSISHEAHVVSRWLLVCAGVVFTIIVVGGITRLTESGLSIVDWRPVTGMLPPMSAAEWEAEFAKYQKYPEYSMNPDMDLKHFKFIFFWEWFHRVLARSVGMVFFFPLVYYSSKGYFNKKRIVQAALFGMFCLGGAQGAMGWYMVKSGLDPKLVEERKKATVSAYRLAAHLSLAMILYASMIRLACAMRLTPRLELPVAMKKNLWDVRLLGRGLFVSLAGTIFSGAFVAGLDAGLLFNDEFPWMLGQWLPPAEEVYKIQPFWRNFTENPVAVQAIHRLMAGMTVYFLFCLNFMMRYKGQRMGRDFLPTHITKAVTGINHAVTLQVLLGVMTIIWSVPIPVAALHQANAVITLTLVLRLLTFVSTRGAIRI